MADREISNERPKIKAINFDLFTNKMKAYGVYPDGYRTLGDSFEKYGFEHRQGSGYVSRQKLTSVQVFMIVQNVTKENAWLKNCVNKMDVSDVELNKQYDLTSIIINTKTPSLENAQEQQQQTEQKPNEGSEKPKKNDNVGLDLVAATMEQCGEKLDIELAQEQARTQQENGHQQVGQVQQSQQVRQVEQVEQARQVKPGKQKIKNNGASGK